MPMEIEHNGQTITVHTQEEVDTEVSGLKNKNNELLDEKRRVAEELDGLKQKINEAEEEKLRLEKEKAEQEGNHKKLLELEREERQKALEQAESLRGSIAQEKENLFLQNVVSKVGRGGDANEDLKDLLKVRFGFKYDHESNQVQVMGDQIKSEEDLIKHITESGRYNTYLPGSGATGGGAAGDNRGGGATKTWTDMTGAERSALRRDNPQQYERLLNEHRSSQ